MSRRPFKETYGPWAVVAGGSEGLGAAFADEIARRGVNVVLVARRPGPLEATAARLRRERAVEVLAVTADLSAAEGLEQVSTAVSDIEIGLLVANAAVTVLVSS